MYIYVDNMYNLESLRRWNNGTAQGTMERRNQFVRKRWMDAGGHQTRRKGALTLQNGASETRLRFQRAVANLSNACSIHQGTFELHPSGYRTGFPGNTNYTILYFTILYYTILLLLLLLLLLLYYTIQYYYYYYTIQLLYYTILYYTILYYTIQLLYCTIQYYTIQCYATR